MAAGRGRLCCQFVAEITVEQYLLDDPLARARHPGTTSKTPTGSSRSWPGEQPWVTAFEQTLASGGVTGRRPPRARARVAADVTLLYYCPCTSSAGSCRTSALGHCRSITKQLRGPSHSCRSKQASSTATLSTATLSTVTPGLSGPTRTPWEARWGRRVPGALEEAEQDHGAHGHLPPPWPHRVAPGPHQGTGAAGALTATSWTSRWWAWRWRLPPAHRSRRPH